MTACLVEFLHMSRAIAHWGWLVVLGSVGIGACGSSESSPSDQPGGTTASTGGGGGAETTPVAIPLAGRLNKITAQVTIGGTQTFALQLDTGSTTLAVAASTCATCAAGAVSPLYAPGSGAVDQQQGASMTYGDSQANASGWSGEIYEDSVVIDGFSQTVPLDLVAITTQTDFFISGAFPYEGILGLGPSGGLVDGTTSYLDQIVAHAGADDVFAIHVCPGVGHLWLGGYDPSFSETPPVFTPMIGDPYYYIVNVSEVQVNGTSLGLPQSVYGSAMLDTGGAGIWLPDVAYAAVVAAIGQSSAFVQEFGDAETFFANAKSFTTTRTKAELDAALPPLTFAFGSNPTVTLQMPATESYLWPYVYKGVNRYLPALAVIDSWFTDQGYQYYLGPAFLTGKVTVHDRRNQRVGFAHAPCE